WRYCPCSTHAFTLLPKQNETQIHLTLSFKHTFMSGPNHIVGGVVFTGLYLSMWDKNIYGQPHFLFFTAFFAVLPDIDHTRSLIGKTFYPVAKFLDRKFGHRTITHSLLCYIALGII